MPRFPALLPVLALVFNALVWGVSWWPFRALHGHGVHPLWATVIVFMLAVVVIGMVRPRAFGQLARAPALWLLALAAGATNAAFNWGVVIGDVVRVVLLFYLMPLWTVLLARWLLHERFTRDALLRVLVGVAGATVVLWPEAPASGVAALPLPRSAGDVLGLLGGMTFALNNVLLRREAAQPEEARAMAMFVGGVVVAGVLAVALSTASVVDWPPASLAWAPIALALALAFLFSNMALQFGAARLPANITAVVLLIEVLFAATTSVLWGEARLTGTLLAGGGLIITAALLSTRANRV